MVNVKTACVGFTLCQLVSITTSSWIYNAPRALLGAASSASASASAATAPLSHIVDLRRKAVKAGQLQEEKNDIEDEMTLAEPNDEGDSANEASPSLFQKKVVKILTKLRLIAQLKQAYHYRPEEPLDEDVEPNSAEGNNTTAAVNNTTSSVNITFEEPALGPLVQEGKDPVDVDVAVVPVNTKISVSKVKSDKLKADDSTRLSNLGVFFAELLGSIVGLTYGAVAQIAAGGQNPVTISMSEGL